MGTITSIRNGFKCKNCYSEEISISEGTTNVEQEIQRAINYGISSYQISYMCLDCGHNGFINIKQKVES